MKDAEGTELRVGDEIVHAYRRSSYLHLSRRKVVLVEEKRIKTEWERDVRLPGTYDTPDGRYARGAQYIPGPMEHQVLQTWVYTSGNVMLSKRA